MLLERCPMAQTLTRAPSMLLGLWCPSGLKVEERMEAQQRSSNIECNTRHICQLVNR